MKVKLIIFSFFLPLFFSCEKWQVVNQNDDIDNVVVVNAVLCPQDSLIKVYVGRVNKLSNNSLARANLTNSNACVTLSDGQKSIKLPFNEKSMKYEIETAIFPLFAEKTYTLNVEYKNKILTAQTTIPQNIVPINLSTKIEGKKLNVGLQWIENNLNKKFYFLEGYGTYVNNNGIPVRDYIGQLGVTVNNLLESSNEKLSKFDLQGFIQYSPDVTRPLPSDIKVILDIYSLDINMVNYLSSIKNSKDSPLSSQLFLERFQTPTLRYSNITSGFGIFMSYNKSEFTKKVNS